MRPPLPKMDSMFRSIAILHGGRGLMNVNLVGRGASIVAASSVARNFFENIGHFAKKYRKFRTPYSFTVFALFIAFLCDNF